MLVLTRKVGEKILIGDSIELTLLEVKGRRVRLGICAPKEIPVHRAEVADEIAHSKTPGLTQPELPQFLWARVKVG